MTGNCGSDPTPPLSNHLPNLIDTNADSMEELMERFVHTAHRDCGRAIVHYREGRPAAAMSIVENLRGVLDLFIVMVENTREAQKQTEGR